MARDRNDDPQTGRHHDEGRAAQVNLHREPQAAGVFTRQVSASERRSLERQREGVRNRLGVVG